MRLTIINQFYKPDLAPTGHLAASLAEHRALRGDVVSVVTSIGGYVDSSPGASGKASANPRLIRLWTPRLGKSRALARIIDYASFYIQAALRVLLLPPQDMIVSLTTPPFVAWVGALHKAIHPATRLLLWNMDSYPEVLERTGVIPAGSLLARMLRRLNSTLFKRLDYLICLDDAMCAMLSNHYLRETSSLPSAVIPNWEPWEQFSDELSAGEWSNSDSLETENRFVVLYLGNAGFGHRFDTLLEAAVCMRDEPVTFLFVGGGKKWGLLTKQKEQLDLENVRLHPYVAKANTPAVMALADCALITLNESALGLISPSKLHSNLAMSLPIIYIGPQGGNVDTAIKRFNCGVSLRHGEVDNLVKFIKTLRSDEGLFTKYQRNARRAYVEAYNDRVTLPQFDEIIDSLSPPSG